MPKIDGAPKNYLTPENWEETHLREVFYGRLIDFLTSSKIGIGRHVGGHTLALQHGFQNYFLPVSYWTLNSYAQKAENVTTSSFQRFPWSLSANFCSERGNS